MRFLVGFLTGLLLPSLIWLLLIWLQIGRPVISSQWVHDVYAKKEALAGQAKGPRILIFGGSNGLFGIDSAALERAFHRDVINMAVNAGLLLPYILYEARRVLRPGDVAIMALEYPMFTYNGEPNEQMISYLYAFDPRFFWFLTWKERLLVLWKTPFSRIVEGLIKTGGAPVTSGVYGVHHIDRNGDQTHTSLADQTEAQRRALASLPPHHYGRDFDPNALAWRYLQGFGAWARRHGVRLIFIPAVMMDDPLYHTDPKEVYFYTHLAQEAARHGLDFRGNPYDFFYPSSLFFNTEFHLTDRGRRINTERLLRLLKGVLGMRDSRKPV